MSSDYKKHQGSGHHEGPDHSSPYPVSRGGQPIDLVDVAKEIQQADRMIGTRAKSKLTVIADQIRQLQEEAQKVLEETRENQELHRAQCNFKRQPGKIYHLYRRDDGSLYFSMLSPEDWNGKPPHEYQQSYRLEADMSWTPVDKIADADYESEIIERLLGSESTPGSES